VATVPRNENGARDEAGEVGDPFAPTAAAAQTVQLPRSFYRLLPAAGAYPFRGLGWAAIIAGAVVFAALEFVASLPVHAGFLLVKLLLRMVLGIGLGGYLAAFMLKVLGASAGGEDLPPDWPDLTSIWEGLIRPLLLLLGAGVLAFGPAIILLWRDPQRVSEWTAWPALWAAAAWAVLYFPMAVIGAALYESFAGLNPVMVVMGIARTLPAYLAAVATFFLCCAAGGLLHGHISGAIPLLGSVAAGAVSLYFIMVEMRVLGLLYRTHARRLGWFE
jgi:hypothetical protein